MVALLEVKASAAQHGDQFDRYDAWAKACTPPVRCYLISLDGEALGAPSDWIIQPSLPCLVRCWQDSSHPHVAWLASAAAEIFEDWTVQADGKLGSAAGPVVGDLIGRRMRTALLAASGSHPGISAGATRQSGSGAAAMVLAWPPFPGQPPRPGAWLCADLRSPCGPPSVIARQHPGCSAWESRRPRRPGTGNCLRSGHDDPRLAHLHSSAGGTPAGG
jgi:hypothetical protein